MDRPVDGLSNRLSGDWGALASQPNGVCLKAKVENCLQQAKRIWQVLQYDYLTMV